MVFSGFPGLWKPGANLYIFCIDLLYKLFHIRYKFHIFYITVPYYSERGMDNAIQYIRFLTAVTKFAFLVSGKLDLGLHPGHWLITGFSPF